MSIFQKTADEKKMQARAAQPAPAPTAVTDLPVRELARIQRNTELKVALHEKLLGLLNLSAVERISRDDLGSELVPVVKNLLAEEGILLSAGEQSQLVAEVMDEVLGLGPLEPLLKDPTISDILVNTHAQVFVEREGRLEPTRARFKDERHLMRIIQKIVGAVGRRVDESQPWVDARLADGSRVNALVPPCAVDGALLSIRKFSKMPFTIDRLVEIGAMDRHIAQVCEMIVRARLNVLISGGTGSGKTTLLNALSTYISNRERIITIEDTAELQLQQTHVGRMETRPPNLENVGEVTLRDLLRNALRMRPDRIIVGEVRGAEVLDMLQAMNTGHDGSITTVHANSPRDALTRLEHMVGMTGVDIPMRSLRSQVASALNVVIQVQRLSDGRRKVVSVQELVGMEGDIVVMQEIFKFERHGIDAQGNVIGHHTPCAARPKFLQRVTEAGIPIPPDLFRSSS